MKTIKPMKLGVLTRTFELDRKCYFVPTVLVLCDFGPEPRLLPEMDLWRMFGAELGSAAIVDECMPKQRGEVLVHGRCFTAGKTPRTGSYVRVKVGAVDKKLYVVGDRTWRIDGTASDPEPFTEMPVTWARAFGGEGFAANPLGVGIAPVQDGDRKVHRLPNIEDPKHLIRAKGDRPTPAGFGPYDVTWPARWPKIGTYDARWLREQMPGFAKDMDLTMWNAAPEDQQFDGFFEGREPILVEHMHPDKPLLEGALPGVIGRCFITQRGADGDVFREIPLHLDTVQLFPDHQRCVLSFRGLTQIAEDDADDIVNLLLGCDDIGAQRPLDHYRAVLERRLDRKREAVELLRDGDLMPPHPSRLSDQSDVGAMFELTRSENLLRKHLNERMRREVARANERIVAAGGDPAASPRVTPPEIEAPPELDTMADFIERSEAEMERQEREAEEGRRKVEETTRKTYAAAGLDYDEEVKKIKRAAVGPPKFSADKEIERLRDIQQLARNGNVATAELDAALADPETERKLREAEAKLKEGYRRGAHTAEDRPDRLAEPERSDLRRRVVEAHAAGLSLADQDFTGADLSKLDLGGADLSGSFFESADLSGARLAGARLRFAVLTAADLRGADLSGADLRDTNLGMANLQGARLDEGADLSNAVLTGADLCGASLVGATFDSCDLSEISMENADLSRATIEKCLVRKNRLAGARFRGAKLTHTTFIEVDLTGADFTNADLGSTTFLQSKIDGACFVNADATAARFIEGCSCVRADFKGAKVERATLRETDLSEADFSGAVLSTSDLSKCVLRGANFYRAVAKNALFMRADLTQASLVAANLEGAIFMKARLGGADFRGANLFRADLLRAVGDDRTSFTDALVTHVRAGASKANG